MSNMLRYTLLGTTAAAVIAFAGAASAQTVVHGGGATLPQPAYAAINTLLETAVPSVTHTYGAVGSGAGRRGFLKQDSTQHGFAAGLPVDFAASDATLSSTEISAWSSTTYPGWSASTGQATAGNLIQLPGFGTPITLAYVSAFAKPFQLSTDDICGIFSGKLTNWNQITGTLSNNAGKYAKTAPTTSRPMPASSRARPCRPTSLPRAAAVRLPASC